MEEDEPTIRCLHLTKIAGIKDKSIELCKRIRKAYFKKRRKNNGGKIKRG